MTRTPLPLPDTLRIVICGSIDDGKSTLIRRLLFESKQIFDEEPSVPEKDSFDVAYSFFATSRRRFVVADTPGHEQYARNMATAASTADAAVLLVDARKGLLTQTRRHSRILAMLGMRHVVIAINKMDLVEWNQAVFSRLAAEYEVLASRLGFATVLAIPVCALTGDNVAQSSARMPWYSGPALLPYLETVQVAGPLQTLPFRMPVQWVNRANQDLRGYCGRVASGVVRVGDRVRLTPSGIETRVKSIVGSGGEQAAAVAGDSVTLCLEDEVDMSRGDVIASAASPVELSDQFEARLLCLSEHHLLPGRPYLFKLHSCQANATVTAIKYRIDEGHGARLAATALELNEIGVVNISTDRPLAFEPYARSKVMGAFILIDRSSNQTVGAGMIDFALRRAANIHWQALDLDQAARAGMKLQKPACLWLTGLSASGKSTIANLLEKRLFALGRHTYLLDGDNVRHGLSRDLGFTEADRVENIRRVAEVARLMVDAGLVVIVSFISPFRAERELARSLFHPGEFMEIFVDTPLAECERRDTKGLYAKARRGELKNFTGIDSPYEPPESPDLRLDAAADGPEDCVDRVLGALKP